MLNVCINKYNIVIKVRSYIIYPAGSRAVTIPTAFPFTI